MITRLNMYVIQAIKLFNNWEQTLNAKMIKDVKMLNREFIDPVMISAMQQMLRKIESLEARVATLENNSA